MNELIELNAEELDLVAGGRGSSVHVKVVVVAGNHDGNGASVIIGSGNGIFLYSSNTYSSDAT